MIFKNYVILIIILLPILPYKIMANEIYLPSAGFDCSDDKYKFEFLFDRSKDMDNPKVYRRVKGKFILRRGFSIKKGSRVLIIEDVITTGKSSMECVKLITKSKAKMKRQGHGAL